MRGPDSSARSSAPDDGLDDDFLDDSLDDDFLDDGLDADYLDRQVCCETPVLANLLPPPQMRALARSSRSRLKAGSGTGAARSLIGASLWTRSALRDGIARPTRSASSHMRRHGCAACLRRSAGCTQRFSAAPASSWSRITLPVLGFYLAGSLSTISARRPLGARDRAGAAFVTETISREHYSSAIRAKRHPRCLCGQGGLLLWRAIDALKLAAS